MNALLRTSLAEAFGTFALVYFGCGAVVVNEKSGALGLMGIALVFGLVIMSLVFALGHVSGSHLNPVVTVSFACAKKFPWNRVLPYIIAQFVGATLGALMIKLSIGTGATLGMTVPATDTWHAFLLEMLMTGLLMFIVMSVATDMRAHNTLAAVAIAGAVIVDVLAFGPLTGASLNPARSFGPALVMFNLENLWIYLTAPMLGGILGGFIYLWCAAE